MTPTYVIASLIRRQFCSTNVHYMSFNRYTKLPSYRNKLKAKHLRKGGPMQVYLEEKIFSELYSSRRSEAAKSVLIHFPKLAISESPELREHVRSLVDAKHVFTFYTDGVYALCELENSEQMENLLSSVTFDPSKETIPVATRLLACTKVPESLRQSATSHAHSAPPQPFQHVLSKCTDLSHQMRTLHEHDQLSDLAARLRFFVCSTFEDMLASIFPQCNVLPFGSSVNGFGKACGDLDMTLSFNPVGLERSNGQNACDHHLRFTGHDHQCVTDREFIQSSVHTLGHMIHSFMPACDNVQCILRARVPIVRFRQTAAKLSCDLSVCDVSGVRMSYLLHRCSLLHPAIPALMSCVREWCRAGQVTHDTYPGHAFTNFIVTTLVIHYLQTIQLLPPLRLILYGEDGHSFTTPDSSREINEGELFINCLKFYVDFQFHKLGISLLDGITVPRPSNSALFIENPLDINLNIAKIINKPDLQRFIQLCESTLELLEYRNVKSNNLWGLAAILTSSFGKRVSDNNSIQKRLNVTQLFT